MAVRRATPIRLWMGLSCTAIPLAFLVAIVVYQVAVAVPDADETRASIDVAFRTVVSVNEVDQAMQDAETAQRGFLITGREEYLAPYAAARSRLPSLMAALQASIGNLAEPQAALLALQADITTKMNELEATIVTYRREGYDAARAIVQTDVGLHAMDAVRADLAAITDAARRSMGRQHVAAVAAQHRVTLAFELACAISALGLLGGAAFSADAYRRTAASEQTLQATLNSVREGVAAFDANGRLKTWNSLFTRLLEIPEAALRRAQPLPTTVGEAAGAPAAAARLRELASAAERSSRPALVSYQTAGGATLELFYTRVPDGYVATALDVSEQRQAEEALRQAQKLEALGQMTGGVAHDFNNLLTIIVGSVDLLRRSVGGDPKAAQRLNMVAAAAERGARLTRQLLAFARRQPLQPDVVNLDRVMQEVLPLLRRAVGDDIVVEYVCAGGLWSTAIDPTQFQSAVLNLAINSRDAMPGGGKLTVEVANAALDDQYAGRHAEVEPGQYVLFAMTDTGAGMDAATMAKALDPFFTTKAADKGTGLGLPQVYGFVKQSGGHMKLYSEVGEGTTVKLYLPRSLQEPSGTLPRAARLVLTGAETVLVVDDDEIVRATVASMLEDLGYTVLAVESGAHALALLEAHRDVALLITDVVMPGIGGRELAERARAANPSLKVLFTSGYTENAIVHNGRLDSGVELLSKPFDRDQLAARVRKVLDGSPASWAERSTNR